MTLRTASLVAALAQGASLVLHVANLAQISQYRGYPLWSPSAIAGIVAQGAMIAFLLTVYSKTVSDA